MNLSSVGGGTHVDVVGIVRLVIVPRDVEVARDAGTHRDEAGRGGATAGGWGGRVRMENVSPPKTKENWRRKRPRVLLALSAPLSQLASWRVAQQWKGGVK